MQQDPSDKVYRFDQTQAARARRLRKEARGIPAGAKRDELMRRATQIEEDEARLKSWMDSPGLKPPI